MSTGPDPRHDGGGARTGLGSGLAATIALITLAIAIALAWLPYLPPRALDRDAAQDAFSAIRAIEHIEAIAREPRPAGSLAHARAQDYIRAQLEALGLQPQIQEATRVSSRVQWMNVAARVINIAAKIEGAGPTHEAVLLVAHYDSVSTSPGANDNGVGVASLLEIARALKATGTHEKDVILLFTDAEEEGLLGAEAFLASHPWAKDIGLVINLEARGSRGPSMLFETSDGNSELIRNLRSAASGTVGSSLFYEVYKRLPNDTDYSAFRQRGIDGLNFAYVGGVTSYHARIDDIASVGPRLVQQHGGNAMKLVGHFANADMVDTRSAGDAVFFNLPLIGLVVYSASLAFPLALATVLLAATAIVMAARRGRIRGRRLVAALILQSVAIAVATGVVVLVWLAIATLLWPDQGWMPLGESYAGGGIFVALLLLAIAILMLLQQFLRLHFKMEELWGAAVLFWASTATVIAWAWPGASYAMTWPAAASALALLLTIPAAPHSSLRRMPSLLASIVVVLFVAPLIWLLYQGLTLNVLAVPVVLALLSLTLMASLFETIRTAAPRLATITPAVISLAMLFALPFLYGFDDSRPRPESLAFVANASSGNAAWISSDEQPGPWTVNFVVPSGERAALNIFGALDYPFLIGISDTPAGMAPPRIELLSDERSMDGRRVRIRVASMRDGEQLWVNVSQAVRVLSASVDDIALAGTAPGDGPWSLRFVAPPVTGFVLTLDVEPGAAFEIQALDRTRGLPDLPLAKQHPRPGNSMSPPHFEALQDSTFIASSIQLPLQ